MIPEEEWQIRKKYINIKLFGNNHIVSGYTKTKWQVANGSYFEKLKNRRLRQLTDCMTFIEGGPEAERASLAFRRPNTNNIMNSNLCYSSSNWFMNETFQAYFGFPIRINIYMSKWKKLK